MSPENLDVEVILFDPASEEHVDRLRQQRTSCGYGAKSVDKWRALQLSKQKYIYWMVLKPNHADYSELLNKYTHCFPLEKDPLLDTAPMISPGVRMKHFIPIGHGALDFGHPSVAKPAQGIYGCSNLYVPSILRGYEFARQAMEAFKFLVAAPPFYGRFLVAEVLSRESYQHIKDNKLFGSGGPKFPLVDWYKSLGWKQLKENTRSQTETDATGKTFMIEMVVMECDIRGYWNDVSKAYL